MEQMKVCTLYSGSSANSTYIEVNGRGILIDAGGGIRKTAAALASVGSRYENLDAVFITHEHSDHIKGLCPIVNKYGIPVLANQKTLAAVRRACPDIDTDLFREMPTGAAAVRNDFEIRSFSSSHDSAESVGYIIKTKNGCIGILTDLGEYTAETVEALSCCKALVLESNHDEDMLWNGSYHYLLKKRIASARGHLSNVQCGTLLAKIVPNGVKFVALAHLSLENNRPELAMQTVCGIVSETGAVVGGDVEICVAPRSECSKVFTL